VVGDYWGAVRLSANDFLLFCPLVDQQPRTCLAGHGDVRTAVSVEVGNANLHTGTDAAAGWTYRMPDEFPGGTVPGIVEQTRAFFGARVAAAVATDAFSGDEFTFAIAIEVSPGQ